MRFTRIKRNPKTYELVLGWEEKRASGDVIEASLSSSELPRPEFIDALQAFRAHVIAVCELPMDYDQDLVITGVSLSQSKDDVRGLVVTAQKTVARAASPVIINTPHVPEASEHGAALAARVVDMIDTLIAEAHRFHRGERAQQELPLDEGEAAPAATRARRAAKRLVDVSTKHGRTLTITAGGKSVTLGGRGKGKR